MLLLPGVSLIPSHDIKILHVVRYSQNILQIVHSMALKEPLPKASQTSWSLLWSRTTKPRIPCAFPLYAFLWYSRAKMAQMLKNLPAVQETWIWSLGWEYPLEEELATHSSILAWRIPWTEEPGRLQFLGSQGWTPWVANTLGLCLNLMAGMSP